MTIRAGNPGDKNRLRLVHDEDVALQSEIEEDLLGVGGIGKVHAPNRRGKLNHETRQQCDELVAQMKMSIEWVLSNMNDPRLQAEKQTLTWLSQPVELSDLNGGKVTARLAIPSVLPRQVVSMEAPRPDFFDIQFSRPVVVGSREIEGFMFREKQPEAVDPLYIDNDREDPNDLEADLEKYGVHIPVYFTHSAESDMANGDPTYTYAAYALGTCTTKLQEAGQEQ